MFSSVVKSLWRAGLSLFGFSPERREDLYPTPEMYTLELPSEPARPRGRYHGKHGKDHNSSAWVPFWRGGRSNNPATKPKRRKSQRKVAQARARKAARRAG